MVGQISTFHYPTGCLCQAQSGCLTCALPSWVALVPCSVGAFLYLLEMPGSLLSPLPPLGDPTEPSLCCHPDSYPQDRMLSGPALMLTS